MDVEVGTPDGGLSSPVDRLLTQLSGCFDQLVKLVEDGGLDGFDDPGLVGFMQGFETFRNRLPLIDHRVIRDATSRDLPGTLTHSTMNRMLTALLRLSPAEAARRVRAAAVVGDRVSMLGQPVAPRWPALAAAQRDGAVSTEQVNLIERALAKVDHRGFDPADLEAGERLLTEHARTFGPKDLAIVAARVVDGIDPDGSRPDDRLNADRRFFDLRPTRDGAYAGEFRLTAQAGAKLLALLGPLAKPRITTLVGPDGRIIEEPDPRHCGQRMHDALEDVCDRMLRTDTVVPDAGGTPATVIITIDLEDLLAGTGYGLTSDGTLIRTDQVRPLIDQAEVYYAFLDRHGVVVNLGRTRRIATRGQSAALIARDRGCSFPGCDRPPEWSERHHVVPWIDGGPTDLNNLTLLCVYHHHNFHSRGWTCRINDHGLPEWTPPRWIDNEQRPMINHRITSNLTARQHRRQ